MELGSKQVFRIEVTLDKTDTPLRAGMAADVWLKQERIVGIDIRIETESGDLYGAPDEYSCPGNPDFLIWLLACTDTSKTVCLRFIDPYGDTTFNRTQARVLLEELAAAQKDITEKALAAAVERKRVQLQKFGVSAEEIRSPTVTELDAFVSRIREMIGRVLQNAHAYVKFVGD